jgi:hypothetical protein
MLKLETFTQKNYIIMYLHKAIYPISLYTYVVTNKDVLILLNGKYIFSLVGWNNAKPKFSW